MQRFVATSDVPVNWLLRGVSNWLHSSSSRLLPTSTVYQGQDTGGNLSFSYDSTIPPIPLGAARMSIDFDGVVFSNNRAIA